jgi:hypothetical protein
MLTNAIKCNLHAKARFDYAQRSGKEKEAKTTWVKSGSKLSRSDIQIYYAININWLYRQAPETIDLSSIGQVPDTGRFSEPIARYWSLKTGPGSPS